MKICLRLLIGAKGISELYIFSSMLPVRFLPIIGKKGVLGKIYQCPGVRKKEAGKNRANCSYSKKNPPQHP
jgi:hypothetical protein